MAALSVLSLNIEGDNHLDKVSALLSEKQPDIFCVQEIFREDLSLFQKQLEVRSIFVPFCRVEEQTSVRLNPRGEWGIALLSRIPLHSVSLHAYVGELNHVPVYQDGDPNFVNRVVIVAEVRHQDQHFFLATTHFTWADKGEATDLQHRHLDDLLQNLQAYRPLVLCGDFNAPRGKSVFERLATEFTDNIPPNVTTTIDPNLHRVKNLELVVDGMFSTPQVFVHDVQVIPNVSDHQAIFAQIG